MDIPALDALTHLHDKSVLVTGAGGSIGSKVCEQIIRSGARQLKLLSLTESALYQIERRLRAQDRACDIIPILGSVGDFELMCDVLRNVDIVIHAAAHKHVPLCESNPIAAIENNVAGTACIAQAAIAAGVKQFVMISTDKAVRPASIMGATKRAAELILRDCLATEHTKIFVVRFGNVIDSAGSVLPLWREQITKGEAITITDPDCERYFMTIPNAVELVLGTIAMNPAGGTFVFDMGARKKLIHLAAELIAASGKEVAIKYIGLRPGEKLLEELHHGESLQVTAHPKIFRIDDSQAKPLEPMLFLDLMDAVKNRRLHESISILRTIAEAE